MHMLCHRIGEIWPWNFKQIRANAVKPYSPKHAKALCNAQENLNVT